MVNSMNIAVYISGHGFGHLAQMAPVLNRIYQIKPDCSFLLRCSLPESEIRSRLNFQFQLDSCPVDVGVIQKNAVEEDRQASIELMQEWIGQIDELIQQEIESLADFNPTIIISNISPLAFPAARALGIPNIALATLDWHSIYSYWLDEDDEIIKKLADAYAQCDLLLTPPMAMHKPVFTTQQQIPLIASRANKVINPVASDRRKKALLLFGGCGNPPYDLQTLANMPDWLFLIPDAPDDAPENVQTIHFNANLRPVDLMPFVDVVLCKPGYGVLSECWSTDTPIVWVERPDFPEFPMLKEWLEKSFPSRGMSRTDFQHGHWHQALEKAHAHPGSFPACIGNGAFDAADLLLSTASPNKTASPRRCNLSGCQM